MERSGNRNAAAPVHRCGGHLRGRRVHPGAQHRVVGRKIQCLPGTRWPARRARPTRARRHARSSGGGILRQARQNFATGRRAPVRRLANRPRLPRRVRAASQPVRAVAGRGADGTVAGERPGPRRSSRLPRRARRPYARACARPRRRAQPRRRRRAHARHYHRPAHRRRRAGSLLGAHGGRILSTHDPHDRRRHARPDAREQLGHAHLRRGRCGRCGA